MGRKAVTDLEPLPRECFRLEMVGSTPGGAGVFRPVFPLRHRVRLFLWGVRFALQITEPLTLKGRLARRWYCLKYAAAFALRPRMHP